MKIIIVGCGKIGTAIISSLVSEGHDVVAVDNSAAAIEEVTNVYDIMCVCGNGADNDTLAEAGVDGCELFVASTQSDETNMLSCLLAKRMGALHTVARIRNPEYNDKSLGFICQQLDLNDPINPDMLAARELYNILKLPNAVNIETFSGRFELIELLIKPNYPIIGMPLLQLRKNYPGKFLICAVQRGQETIIPSGGFVLNDGDRIALTAETTEIQKLLRRIGIMQKSAVRNVMILGASRTAYYLAKLLIEGGNSVKIIEQDAEKCREMCSELPDAVVIHGDGARQEVLLEEGLGSMNAFVALTGSDEENILISIYASSRGVGKVIAKVNRPELASMAEKLGLECIVSPNKIVSNILSSYARALQNSSGSNVEALYRIMDDKAEAAEFRVSSDFPYIGITLKDMKLKPNILIAGIIRGRRALIPAGDDRIMSGDRVIVLAAGHRLDDLSDIVLEEK